MLLYIDHGACRKIITSLQELEQILQDKPWTVLSLMPYITDPEARDKIAHMVIERWLKITGSVRFVEDAYTLITGFRTGLIDSITMLRNKIVRLLSEVPHYMEDIFLLNVLLKIMLDYALPDIGLVVIYENPLYVEQGYRQRPLPIRGVILRKVAKAVYESKIAKSVRELELEYVLVKNGTEESIRVVDWSSMGLYAYSPQNTSIIDMQEVADPLLCTLLNFRYKITTCLTAGKCVVVHYRDIREVVPYMYTLKTICRLVQDSRQILALPSTMTNLELTVVKATLQKLNVEIMDIVKIPVDILVASCIDKT